MLYILFTFKVLNTTLKKFAVNCLPLSVMRRTVGRNGMSSHGRSVSRSLLRI